MIGRRACTCFTPFIPYTRRKALVFEGLSLSEFSDKERGRPLGRPLEAHAENREPLFFEASYIMPPPGGIIGAGFSSGSSATTHSVVRMFLAIEAAFCSAERVTRAGSMIPAFTRSS